MANIGTLAVSVVSDTATFIKGITKAKSGILGFIKSAQGISMIQKYITQLGQAVWEAQNRINDMNRSAKAFGVAYKDMKMLSDMARTSGTSLDRLQQAMGRTASIVTKANEGNKQAVEFLESLGLAAEDFNGLSLPDQMAKLGKAIVELNDPAQKADAAMKAFGESARELNELFSNMDKHIAMARQSNQTFTDEQLANNEEAISSWKRLGIEISNVADKAGISAAATSNYFAESGRLATELANEKIGSKESWWWTLLKTGNPALMAMDSVNTFGNAYSSKQEKDNMALSEQLNRGRMSQVEANEERLNPTAKSANDALKGNGIFSKITGAINNLVDKLPQAMEDAIQWTNEALQEKFEKDNELIQQSIDKLDEQKRTISSVSDSTKEALVFNKTAGFDPKALAFFGKQTGGVDEKQLIELERQTSYLQQLAARNSQSLATLGA
jgi:hypothetical protein